jgi:hypothetical protein
MRTAVTILDPTAPNTRSRAVALLSAKHLHPVTWAEIEAKTTISEDTPPLYVGALRGEDLVGVVALSSHDLICRGRLLNCFQICAWATVAPSSEIQTLARMLDAAKTVLTERDVGFIFAFPDHDLTRALRPISGSKDYGGFLSVRVPKLPLAPEVVLRRWSDADHLLIEDSFLQNDAQLLRAKRRRSGAAIWSSSSHANVLWGRSIQRSGAAHSWHPLSVGGMIVNSPHFFSATVRQTLKRAPISGVVFSIHHSSSLQRLFRRCVVNPRSRRLTVWDLAVETTPATVFEFCAGIDAAY